jgi:alkylated DNA repair dioxygenase AlkB
MPAMKLSRPDELPEGFLYREDFLSKSEESDLLRIFRTLDFIAYDYHGFLAKRRTVRYGVNYDINTRAANESAPPIPEFLLSLRERAANFVEVPADALVQALISEYSVGTPIGWHRDTPQFGTIIGISLGSACRMRLKPYQARARETAGKTSKNKILSVRLEPRSIYVMRGAARSQWQHSIPAVDELRYSITFRSLRTSVARTA